VNEEFMFVLISNPEEETDWDVKCRRLDESCGDSRMGFNLALLEPPLSSSVSCCSRNVNPKDHYVDLIFNKSSFSSQTICQALRVRKLQLYIYLFYM